MTEYLYDVAFSFADEQRDIGQSKQDAQGVVLAGFWVIGGFHQVIKSQ